MLIIDAVLARDEFDLIRFRTEYLSGLMDALVIGESRYTFSGTPKPQYFSELKKQGRLPKHVLVLEIELFEEELLLPEVDIQNIARNRFATAVFDCFPGGLVFFQDADEIPSREQVELSRNLPAEPNMWSVPMSMYCRRVNWVLKRRASGWFGARVLRAPPVVENMRSSPAPPIPGQRGAHLSYLRLDAAALQEKFRHYGRQEFNRPNVWNPSYLRFCDRFGVDHQGLASRSGFGLLQATPAGKLGDVELAATEFSPEWAGPEFTPIYVYRLICAQVAAIHVESGGRMHVIHGDGTRPTLRGLMSGSTKLVCFFLPEVINLFLRQARKTFRHVGRHLRSYSRRNALTQFLN